MIQVDTSSAYISYTGGTFYVDVTYENTAAGAEDNPSVPSWVTTGYIGAGAQGSDYVESYSFTVDANTGGTRNGTITFSCTDRSGNTWVNYLYIHQGSAGVVYAPIWQDTYYYAANHSELEYSIKYNGVSVYFGKAYCAPGDGGPYIQVNKLCQNFLKNNLDLTPDSTPHPNEGAVAFFSLCDSNGLELCNYWFLMDYAGDWDGDEHYVMSEPINGHLDPRMLILHTEYNEEQTDVNITIELNN